MEETNVQSFDIIVAGAGLAGVLAVARLHERHPDCSILLIEKDDALGGRLRSTSEAARRWSFGLGSITPELFHFWDQTLKQDPEAQDLPSFMTGKYERAGVISGAKVAECDARELWTEKGARAIAGAAAARDWKTVTATFEHAEKNKKDDHAFGAVWAGTRKNPSAIVMEQLSHVWGIPDLWEASVKMVKERAGACKDGFYVGQWEKAIDELLKRPTLRDKLTIKASCRIIDAKYENEQWHVQTAQGAITGSSLVVAQSPWEALQWLNKNNCPEAVLLVANKSKPVSIVVLSEKIVSDDELPQVLMIPSEDVQIFVNEQKEICFQATLDYEITMQAPEVVKAVKRLRRARKKLQLAYPNLKVEGDHLVLLPVGWSQPTNHSDRRWVEKLAAQSFQAKHLAFCGDSYGAYCDGDKNILQSVQAAADIIASPS